jgi:hypothetical protein
MQPDRHGIDRYPQDRRNLGMAELLPRHEAKQLLVVGGEAGERLECRLGLGGGASIGRSAVCSSLCWRRPRRRWPRRWLPSVFRATAYSHGRASSPAGTSSSRRQATRKTSATTSSASMGRRAPGGVGQQRAVMGFEEPRRSPGTGLDGPRVWHVLVRRPAAPGSVRSGSSPDQAVVGQGVSRDSVPSDHRLGRDQAVHG